MAGRGRVISRRRSRPSAASTALMWRRAAAQVGSGVQDIGADDDIELVGMEALKERVAADVPAWHIPDEGGRAGEAVPGPGRDRGETSV